MDRNKVISNLRQIKTLADECLASLGEARESKRARTKLASAPAQSPKAANIDFDKPLRPFIKQYAKGMSGAKKFTLILSWLAKGELKKEVQHSEIEKKWNRMTAKSLLGQKYNRFFPAEAKDNDWVELKKKGIYCLRPSWKEIFQKTNA